MRNLTGGAMGYACEPDVAIISVPTIARMLGHRPICIASRHAALHGINEQHALQKGMEEKPLEFTEKRSELYAKA